MFSFKREINILQCRGDPLLEKVVIHSTTERLLTSKDKTNLQRKRLAPKIKACADERGEMIGMNRFRRTGMEQ